MSTLTSMLESSPVRVLQVLADFSQGVPTASTVFVDEKRHAVQVYRTAEGLMARCECPYGCAAGSEAIQAVQIMTEVWERGPRADMGPDASGGGEPELGEGLDRHCREGRPYDGLARGTCEADLDPRPVPAWAYDEHGLRRPLCEALVVAEIWCELDGALDRLLGECPSQSADPNHSRNGQQSEFKDQHDVLRYYRASWEPMLRLSESAYEVNLFPALSGSYSERR